jgi:hypothetical protein
MAARADPTRTAGDSVPTPKRPARRLAARPIAARGRKPPNKTPPLPEKRNSRAVRHGAAADGANLPLFDQTRAEVQAALDEAEWLKATDALLLDVFVRELHAYRYTSDALARLGDTALFKKLNAVKLQIRRARVLGELADRLGLSPQSRFKLGLVVAKTEAVRVQPVRSGPPPVWTTRLDFRY